MSLVSTYVRAVDGKLYRDPIVVGNDWFLCFDDDDPPELVVRAMGALPELQCIRAICGHTRSFRCFTGDLNDDFVEADSYWCELVSPIPVPQRHDGVVALEDIKQGVIYDPKG